MTIQEKKLYRMLDANFNRSREGLRVCEDVARFVADDPALSLKLKTARHRISSIRKSLPESADRSLVLSRDVSGDTVKDARIRSRTRRDRPYDIFASNMQRSKESVRVLEEVFKLIDESVSSKLSKIRFTIYEIEQAASMRMKGRR